MEEIIIHVREAMDGGYLYDIYEDEAEFSADRSLDGGLCTTTLKNAFGMALSQAHDILRNEFQKECDHAVVKHGKCAFCKVQVRIL